MTRRTSPSSTCPPSPTSRCAPSCCAWSTSWATPNPAPIQAESIAPLVEGRDLLGQAATGTGKTAAFALPMLERLAEQRPEPRPRRRARSASSSPRPASWRCRCPRRSPATARGLGARVAHRLRRCAGRSAVAGLHEGVDVVVATPGRAIDLMNRGALRLDELEIVVLDEADEMLDMGFVEDIETLLDATPDTRQAVLFSRDHAAPHRDAGAEVPARAGHRADPPRGGARGRGAEGPPDRLPGAAHAHHRRAGPRAGGRAARRRRSCSAAPGSTSTPSPRRSPPAACAPRRCTAAWTRSTAPAWSSGCAAGAPSCSSPPTWPPAAWTSTCSRTSSTTTCRSRPRPTCTASAGSAGPGARAWRSRWCRRRRCTRCAPSSGSPGSRSRSPRCPTAADLRAARLERTRAALRGAAGGDVDDALDGAQSATPSAR